MGYRYLDDFRRGISVLAIFSYGFAVLGTPQCRPPLHPVAIEDVWFSIFSPWVTASASKSVFPFT